MKAFSIIIPVYNEAKILKTQVRRLIAFIESLHFSEEYELILVENGSTDSTYVQAKKLVSTFPQIKLIHIDQPSYGQAFKAGIRNARYDYIYQFDLDFWDIDFLSMSHSVLERYDIVLGSKNLSHSHDDRTLSRKFMSKMMETLINLRFNVQISDTHGLKAMKKDKILSFIDEVTCSNHFFDSELLLRCYQKGLRFKEIPVNLKEIRKSRFPFLIRFREVIIELLQLIFIDLKRGKTQKNNFVFHPAMTARMVK
jgi:glycosyltransferase involved in cell wall biosynthesis